MQAVQQNGAVCACRHGTVIINIQNQLRGYTGWFRCAWLKVRRVGRMLLSPSKNQKLSVPTYKREGRMLYEGGGSAGR